MESVTLIDIEFRGAGKRFRRGRWYTLARGDNGRKLSVRCVDVDGDVVTFAFPQMAEA